MKCEIFKLSRCKFAMCRCTWGGLLNQPSFSFDNWDLFNHLHHEMRYAANCSEVHSRCVSTCERLKDNARWMNSSQPQGAPNTAYQGSEFSFNWLETVQHLSEKQANSPDPRTRSLNGQEFLKKTKQAGRCFGNAKRVHCQGIFGTRDLQIIGHGGPDLIWPQDSELETSSNAVRQLCFNFEETFNLQIPCQQTATVVVACKTFFRHHRVCERKLWHHWS